MSAYFVASYKITDPAGYAPYAPAAIPTLLSSGCEILAADYASQTLDGDPREVTVILKFASKQAGLAWYNSPQYQAIKHLRTDNSEGTSVMVDQWTPPE
jgi:uncharacterized protein (DUF1330 family)